MKEMKVSEKAKKWASEVHASVNHTYNDKPYAFHLKMVADAAERFIHLIPSSDREAVLAACWAHDTIEDCRVTYNDVKQELGYQVAELVYAVTNEKGKNRKERANEKYYSGIRNTKHATFVKICDRIANVEYSVKTNSSMMKAYKKEYANFFDSLYASPQYGEMWEYLSELTNGKQITA